MALRFLILLAALAATDVDARIAELRDRDPARRLAAVEVLRAEPGERVSKALAGALRDRDAKVRVAVVRALGGRPDETALRALRKSLRTFAKDADTLPAVVVALGESGDAESAGAVFDLARKSLGADPRLAEASIDALGRMRAPDAVEGLIELLGTAEPVRGGAAARTGHARYVPGIRQSLREVTGLPFRDVATWRGWWRHARRGWKAAPLDPETVEGRERRDDAWRFSIERPDATRWGFERVEGAALRVRFAGPREEAAVAWIDVIVRSAVEPERLELSAAVKSSAERIREGLVDEKEVSLGEAGRLGTVAARMHRVLGLTDAGRPVRRTTYVLEARDLIYVVEVHVASGASEAVDTEVNSILGSFRLL